ncbi:MAG: hypothetical protein H0T76_11155 [Nannocystis sp.]|nr:hypothetical protein [Nannocystis sp.]
MPANFTAILLELHRRVPGRALWAGLLWLVKQLNFLVLLSASLVFVVDLVRPHRGCISFMTIAHHEVINVVKAIEQFQLQHQDRCPRDLDEMKTAGVVSRVQKDPWGRPFVIECSETKIRVCSHGRVEVDAEDDVCHEESTVQPTPAGEPGAAVTPLPPVPIDTLLRWPVVDVQEGAEGLLHPHALKAADFMRADPR